MTSTGASPPASLASFAIGALVVVAGLALDVRPACARDPKELLFDTRDRWTLLPQYLLNRQLFEQLDTERRLGPGRITDWLAVSADLMARSVEPQAAPVRFHGMFMADTYVAVRLVDGLDANLNLTIFDPSVSDPFRSSAQVVPGLALHAYGDVFDLDGDPLHVDFLTTDLGYVTAGAGLLLESTPLGGILFQARWREAELRWLFGGRSLWPDDDFISTQLALFGRLLTLQVVQWNLQYDLNAEFFGQVVEAANQGLSTTVTPPDGLIPWYATATLDLPIPVGIWRPEELHLAVEYGTHLVEGPKSALLARADYLTRGNFASFHLGYQFRWYQRGFGPRGALVPATQPFSLPRREDTYATSSFETLPLSGKFDQWSHTAMAELRVRPEEHFEFFAEAEVWLRFARGDGDLVAIAPDGFEAPGRKVDVYYRAGAALMPWPQHPIRFQAHLTNKHTEAGDAASSLVERRFIAPATKLGAQLEVKL